MDLSEFDIGTVHVLGIDKLNGSVDLIGKFDGIVPDVIMDDDSTLMICHVLF